MPAGPTSSVNGALVVVGSLRPPATTIQSDTPPVVCHVGDQLRIRSSYVPAAAGATSSVAPQPVQIDPAHLVPGWSDLIRYDGSLTTPPCSEGVLWSVYERPRKISTAQLGAFTAVHPENSRPVQPLNGRTLFEVDAD